MIYETKMYACKCDGCGEQWDNGDCITAHGEREETRYGVEASNWYICEDGRTYCPDCYIIDDNDQPIFKSLTPNSNAHEQ